MPTTPNGADQFSRCALAGNFKGPACAIATASQWRDEHIAPRRKPFVYHAPPSGNPGCSRESRRRGNGGGKCRLFNRQKPRADPNYQATDGSEGVKQRTKAAEEGVGKDPGRLFMEI